MQLNDDLYFEDNASKKNREAEKCFPGGTYGVHIESWREFKKILKQYSRNNPNLSLSFSANDVHSKNN